VAPLGKERRRRVGIRPQRIYESRRAQKTRKARRKKLKGLELKAAFKSKKLIRMYYRSHQILLKSSFFVTLVQD
jgi:hypothetical protein